jgi:hypothetical protein
VTIDSGRSFVYMFEDPAWISKFLIGGLLTVTVAMIPSMVGYEIDTARRVRDGLETPLPEWGQNFGGRWVRGLSFLAIIYIWALVPVIVVACIAAAIGGALGASSGTQSAGESAAAAAYIAGNCLSFPISILIALVSPSLMSNYVNRGSFVSGFEFGRLWAIASNNWGMYLLVAVLYGVATLFIVYLGFLACAIGIIFTAPYSGLIVAHLVGQLSRPENQPRTFATEPI